MSIENVPPTRQLVITLQSWTRRLSSRNCPFGPEFNQLSLSQNSNSTTTIGSKEFNDLPSHKANKLPVRPKYDQNDETVNLTSGKMAGCWKGDLLSVFIFCIL